MRARIAVIFGQFGAAADPVNLPAFRFRLTKEGMETILVEHTDTRKVIDFFNEYVGFCGLIGASLGAGAAPLFAGYMRGRMVNFVGGFQPSDYDPVMHAVQIQSGLDLIIRAVTVPSNVYHSLCFRNPAAALTGGLGHATYIVTPDNQTTNLNVIEREDAHPGDFGEAADTMFQTVMGLAEAWK